MNFRLFCFFCLLLIYSCEEEYQLLFEQTTYGNTPCELCATVQISIPKAKGTAALDNAINTALKEELIYILNFDETDDATDIESAIATFSKGYTDLKSKFIEEATPWEAKISGELSYEDTNFISIKINSYIFTGGAHGYSTTRFLNFDKLQALELNTEDLFHNQTKFTALAALAFRSQEQIPLHTSINSTGFMFDNDTFYIPENIGYTQEGLQLFYEQYEIASYADGPIKITLPFLELKDHLKYTPKALAQPKN